MRGNQGAVTAFFLGAAELGLGVLGALAFKIGVGQIVQHEAPLQIEQGLLLRSTQNCVQRRLVLKQLIADGIPARQADAAKVIIKQFTQAGACLQPVMGLQFAAAGRNHAA